MTEQHQIEEMAKVIGNTWLVDLEGDTKDACEVLDEVDIKGIAREAGSRTKIAVCSKDPNVDCVGACIGPRRSRIRHRHFPNRLPHPAPCLLT